MPLSNEVYKGTAVLYGTSDLTGALASAVIVQSINIDSEFANETMVQDHRGNTIAWRADDRKTSVSLELVAKATAVPVLGANIRITGMTNSSYTSGTASQTFDGWITKVSEKGTHKDFVTLSVSAIGYEGINTNSGTPAP